MTDSTPLSPAAQAVKDAAQGLYADRIAQEMAWPLDLPVIAAALRAAADQVMPERPLWSRRGAELTLYHEGRLDAAIRFRAELLAIADELEGVS